jgi:PAS domain S-box-containing protein
MVLPRLSTLPVYIPASAQRVFRKVPLYLVMVVPLLVQVVGVVGAVGWFSYRNGQQAVNEVATQLRNEAGNRIHQHLDDYLTKPVQINRTNADAVDLGLLNVNNFSTTGKYFWRQMQTFNVGYISFGKANGDFIGVERLDNGKLLINEVSAATGGKADVFAMNAMGDRTQKIITRTWFPQTEPWYTETIKAGKPVWSPIYQWQDKPEVMSVSANYPLYDRDRRLIGVLSIDQILTQISQFLHKINVSPSARTFVLERSGALVATSSADEKPFLLVNGDATRLNASESEDPLIQSSASYLLKKFGSFQHIQSNQQLDFSTDGSRQFLLAMPWKEQSGLDWLIVVVVPESDFMAQIHANTRNTIASCAIALFLGTLFGVPISRWIARQILQLSRASEALAAGKLDQTVHTKGIAELETLAHSFNRMAEQLRGSFAELEQTNEMLEQRVEDRTASLAAAEAELRAVFAAMTDLVIVYNRQGYFLNLIATNPGTLIRPISNQVGKHVGEIVPAPQAEAILNGIQTALNTWQVVNVEYSLTIGEETLWFSANVSPLSDETVLWVARDMSDRKRMEETRKQDEANLRKQNRVLLELAKSAMLNQGYLRAAAHEITVAAVRTLKVDQAGIWLLNADKNRLHCINQFSRVTEAHTSGITLTAADFPRYFQALEEDVTIAADDAHVDTRTQELVEPYLNPTGVASMLDAPIRSSGKTVGVICLEQVGTTRQWTVEDQSFVRSCADLIALAIAAQERRRAEEALYEKEQYLRLILNNIPQQVFWKDTDLVFLGCNQNWAEATRLNSPDEIIGKTDFDLLPDAAIAEQFRAQDRRIIQSDTPQIHLIAPKVNTKDGKLIWLDISKIPIHDANQNVIGILGVIEDITQRKQAEEALILEQEKSESLLLNVLPVAIADQLKQTLGTLDDRPSKALIAESFDEVTVLFADIVNFTSLSANVSAADLVGLLNRIFLVFDDLSEKHGLEKIKTIGDAYMVVGGLPNPRSDHAAAIANMALDMQQDITQFCTFDGHPISVRIGINTGAVVAGVIGRKKFTYDLWGDVVNTASRMESHGTDGKIQVTAATYNHLKDAYYLEPRGAIEVKGKGSMETYWLVGKR